MLKDLIQKTTQKAFRTGIEKYAKRYEVLPTQVQIALHIKNNEVKYHVYIDYRPAEEVGILDIMNVKMDMMGVSQSAPPFIAKLLKRFAKEIGCKEIERVSYYIVLPTVVPPDDILHAVPAIEGVGLGKPVILKELVSEGLKSQEKEKPALEPAEVNEK